MKAATRHPDARLGRVYAEAFGAAIRVWYSRADAREYATAAVERERLRRIG